MSEEAPTRKDALEPELQWLTSCRDAVVVGDDGSDDAATAMRWAFADSQRRRVPLAILRGWSLTTAPRPRDAEAGYVPSEEEFEAAVEAEMADDVRRALGDPGDRALADGSIVLVPVHQPIEQVLIAATGEAAITVVGARGAGLARLLGSVSTSVVRHARGPVAVIPRSPAAKGASE